MLVSAMPIWAVILLVWIAAAAGAVFGWILRHLMEPAKLALRVRGIELGAGEPSQSRAEGPAG